MRNGKMNKAMGEGRKKSQKKYFEIKECKEISRILKIMNWYCNLIEQIYYYTILYMYVIFIEINE